MNKIVAHAQPFAVCLLSWDVQIL